MANPLAFLAPLVLLLPVFGGEQEVPPVPNGDVEARLEPSSAPMSSMVADEPVIPMVAPYAVPIQRQVRIEQRVIVRISPRQPTARQSMFAELPTRAPTSRFEERKMEKCVPVANVVGVQTGSGNRLLLFLNDRRTVTASLEKSCRARDFYSGFYIERSDDGMLCVDRDKLQSRSGANCEVERMRQLVAVEE